MGNAAGHRDCDLFHEIHLTSLIGITMYYPWPPLLFPLRTILLTVATTFFAAAFSDTGIASDAAVAQALQPFIDRHELAGAVTAIVTGDTVSMTSVGFADIDSRRRMSDDTMFWIASQSKPITAAAVMILVDQGKIRLDNPVEQYLPEFRDLWLLAEKSADREVLARPAAKPTVRQLLCHMSGLPFRCAIEQPTLDCFPLRARVLAYAALPLEHDPGTHYQYSNAGINTAARIVEVVSHQPFETFLQQSLLDPLSMSDTTFWPSDEQIGRLATAYRPTKTKDDLEPVQIDQLFYPLSNRAERTPMPAGGLFGTAHDLICFYQMLLGEGTFRGKAILSADAVRELTHRQTPEAVKESYGLGLSANEDNFGHGGAFGTNTSANRNTQRITVWLVQHAGYVGRGGEAQHAFEMIANSPDR